MVKKRIKKIFYITIISAVAIILLLVTGLILQTLSKPNYVGSQAFIGVMFMGIITGALVVYLFLQYRSIKKSLPAARTESHTVVESIKRVFKIVVAEGQMNEIFSYENTKKLLNIIPSTKKALVIVNAKVMIGYDINQCKWEVDEDKKVIRLLSFPKPEILSLETDFNYYYFEDDLFNFIRRQDLQEIQHLAKEQVKKAALQSGLLKISADQMKFLLGEVVSVNNWQIENINLIDDYSYPVLPEEGTGDDQEKAPVVKRLNLKEDAVNILKRFLPI